MFTGVEAWNRVFISAGYGFYILKTETGFGVEFGGELGYILSSLEDQEDGTDFPVHTAIHFRITQTWKEGSELVLYIRSCQNIRKYVEARLGVCMYLGH